MGRRVFIVALAALAITGGSAVASGWVITSTKQIKPSVLRQLHGARGPRGYTGADGGQGPQGAQGSAGIATVHDTQSAPAPYCASGGGACQVAQATATCPGGSYVVGGAASVSTIETHISTFAGPTSYAAVSDNASSFTGQLTATAICASGPGLQSAVRRSASQAAADRIAARLRSQH
jgi:hypothetical protein